MIPRAIHFLWDFLGNDAPLGVREAGIRDDWRGLHPGWQVDVCSPEYIQSLMSPGLQTMYDQLPVAIQRCDLARPVLLKKVGGVYSDLDVRPRQPLEGLFELYPDANVLLAEEVTLSRGSSIRRGKRHSIREGRPELRLRVANFWMASVPGHPFWGEVIDLIEARRHLPVREDYDVIYTTGPDVISEVYNRCINRFDDVQMVPRRLARKFFRHQAHGSWRRR